MWTPPPQKKRGGGDLAKGRGRCRSERRERGKKRGKRKKEEGKKRGKRVGWLWFCTAIRGKSAALLGSRAHGGGWVDVLNKGEKKDTRVRGRCIGWGGGFCRVCCGTTRLLFSPRFAKRLRGKALRCAFARPTRVNSARCFQRFFWEGGISSKKKKERKVDPVSPTPKLGAVGAIWD